MGKAQGDMLRDLRQQIISLQGGRAAPVQTQSLQLGPVMASFPEKAFPIGGIHEWVFGSTEDISATTGFIAGILSSLIPRQGPVIWIRSGASIFPPALKQFQVSPEQVIFLDLKKEKDIGRAMDESLQCTGISAVIASLRSIDLSLSRRFQLAAERSRVTGFVLRNNNHALSSIASLARWQVTSLPAWADGALPGIAYPRWRISLLKVRNGKTGTWEVCWKNGFEVLLQEKETALIPQQKQAV